MKSILDPKVDFIFKNIFGTERNSDILISFLNATIKPKKLITKVEIKNTDISKEYLQDKYSILDIKATTSNDEIINVEIQLKNQYNMIRRTLYYWSKLYAEKIGEGENYSNLKRTVCINILNFKYLKNDRFHNAFRLKEIETSEELTDIEEIHFIEIPKLSDNSDEKDMLVAWTEFLKNPESEKVRGLEGSIKEIKKAKDELIRISNDDKERELYEMRQKAIRDEVNALSKAKEEGLEQGIKKGIIEQKIVAIKNMSDLGLDKELIAKSLGITIEEVENYLND